MMYAGDEFYGDEITSGPNTYPQPIVRGFSSREIEMMLDEGFCQATDGCVVEPDGECEHGHPSWAIVYGYI